MKDEFDPKEVQKVLEETMKPNLPEAPQSIHVDAYYKGFHAGFTIRKENNDSVAVASTINLIDSLIEKGFKPSWNDDTNKTNGHPVAPNAPKCGVHGTAMEWKAGVSKKTNRPYAFWSCPTRNADGSYCNYQHKDEA